MEVLDAAKSREGIKIEKSMDQNIREKIEKQFQHMEIIFEACCES